MSEQRKMYADLKDELLITRDQIAVRVKEMGAEITRDFEGKDLTVICILKGAVVFFVDLIREIDLPMTMDFMAISSYGSASSRIWTSRSTARTCSSSRTSSIPA